MAGLLTIAPATFAAGPNDGNCGAAFSPAGQVVTNPATGGTYYINQTGGPTGGAAGAGVGGSPGFIEVNATGAAGPPPSGSVTVEGNQTQSGVNSKVVVSSTPSACAGSSVAGVGVGVP